jgi:hypothetical protein
MLGGEIFEDRRRLPQHEVVLDEGRHLAVRILGQVVGRAGFSNARIAADAIQWNAELGREQAHFARVRGFGHVIRVMVMRFL